MHRTVAFLSAVVLTTLSFTAAGFAAQPDSFNFTIERGRSVDQVQLSLRDDRAGHHSNWSQSFAVAELRGFRIGGAGPLSFAIIREAGRFDCSGQAGGSSANGECRFAPDPGFADFLASRGIARPTRDQAYALAMSNVSRGHVEALAAFHYPNPTVDQLVAMGIHGATPAFIRDLAASGYRLRSADDLVTFRIHGVDGAYIRAITAAGPKLRNIPADDLVAFRIHGVTPRYIEELAALGYRALGADDLVQMRIFGVSPDFIRSVEGGGAERIPVAELVQMRIMGWRRAR